MLILGIETSCDETAAAVVRGQGEGVEVLSNVVSSQIDIHKKYGGVVPEVAAREHVLSILPVVNEALEVAGIERKKASKKLDALAVTVGPGLITSLQVGVETAKVLAYAWKLPVVGVNHIEGHIYANFIRGISNFPQLRTPQRDREFRISNLFPAVVLTVSGGHTMLVLIKRHGKYKVLGETRDDAAGEAFDKAAKLLGLGFPGGPEISTEADKFQVTKSKFQTNSKSQIPNIKNDIVLPRPMIDSPNYDFSFSGLKTALLYQIKKDKAWKKKIPEYAHEFEQAVADVLVKKTVKAAREFKAKTVMVTGGVSANKVLREEIEKVIKKELSGVDLLIPELKYTTDNAAMIAAAGYYQALKKNFTPWEKLKADCNLELK